MIDLSKQKIVAVVGASNHPEKYGNKVVKKMLACDYTVWPINLNEVEIEGLKVYPKLENLPSRPDLIVFVVPPAVSLSVLDEVVALKYDNVWFQPGAFDEVVIAMAESLGLTFENHRCVLVELAR